MNLWYKTQYSSTLRSPKNVDELDAKCNALLSTVKAGSKFTLGCRAQITSCSRWISSFCESNTPHKSLNFSTLCCSIDFTIFSREATVCFNCIISLSFLASSPHPVEFVPGLLPSWSILLLSVEAPNSVCDVAVFWLGQAPSALLCSLLPPSALLCSLLLTVHL